MSNPIKDLVRQELAELQAAAPDDAQVQSLDIDQLVEDGFTRFHDRPAIQPPTERTELSAADPADLCSLRVSQFAVDCVLQVAGVGSVIAKFSLAELAPIQKAIGPVLPEIVRLVHLLAAPGISAWRKANVIYDVVVVVYRSGVFGAIRAALFGKLGPSDYARVAGAALIILGTYVLTGGWALVANILKEIVAAGVLVEDGIAAAKACGADPAESPVLWDASRIVVQHGPSKLVSFETGDYGTIKSASYELPESFGTLNGWVLGYNMLGFFSTKKQQELWGWYDATQMELSKPHKIQSDVTNVYFSPYTLGVLRQDSNDKKLDMKCEFPKGSWSQITYEVLSAAFGITFTAYMWDYPPNSLYHGEIWAAPLPITDKAPHYHQYGTKVASNATAHFQAAGSRLAYIGEDGNLYLAESTNATGTMLTPPEMVFEQPEKYVLSDSALAVVDKEGGLWVSGRGWFEELTPITEGYVEFANLQLVRLEGHVARNTIAFLDQENRLRWMNPYDNDKVQTLQGFHVLDYRIVGQMVALQTLGGLYIMQGTPGTQMRTAGFVPPPISNLGMADHHI